MATPRGPLLGLRREGSGTRWASGKGRSGKRGAGMGAGGCSGRGRVDRAGRWGRLFLPCPCQPSFPAHTTCQSLSPGVSSSAWLAGLVKARGALCGGCAGPAPFTPPISLPLPAPVLLPVFTPAGASLPSAPSLSALSLRRKPPPPYLVPSGSGHWVSFFSPPAALPAAALEAGAAQPWPTFLMAFSKWLSLSSAEMAAPVWAASGGAKEPGVFRHR